MYIYSQDKKKLMPVEAFKVRECNKYNYDAEKNETKILYSFYEIQGYYCKSSFNLGNYSTKDKALAVMEQIKFYVQQDYRLFDMPQDEEVQA